MNGIRSGFPGIHIESWWTNMLPDFPTVKKQFWFDFKSRFQEFSHSDGVLSHIKDKPIFEGNLTSQTLDGQTTAKPPEVIAEQLEFDRPRIIDEGVIYVMQILANSAKRARAQKAKLLFKEIDESSSKAGTSFDAGGKPFTLDMYLEMLRSMEIEFDSAGQAQLPTLVTGNADIKAKVETWFKDPECLSQINAVVEEKGQEWRDRQSNRKLAD